MTWDYFLSILELKFLKWSGEKFAINNLHNKDFGVICSPTKPKLKDKND